MLQADDYVTDSITDMPMIQPTCMTVSFMPFPTYTWVWFSGPSPPASVDVSATQLASSGGFDIWGSPSPPGPALASPSTTAQCLA